MGKTTYTYEELRKLGLKIPHNLPYAPYLAGKGVSSSYSDIIEVELDGFLLEEGYEYRIDQDSIEFLDDALPKQKIYNIIVRAYVDLNLFMKIYTCNQNQLALFLTSPDYKERALAEIRYREIESSKKFSEKLKEVLDENNKKDS